MSGRTRITVQRVIAIVTLMFFTFSSLNISDVLADSNPSQSTLQPHTCFEANNDSIANCEDRLTIALTMLTSLIDELIKTGMNEKQIRSAVLQEIKAQRRKLTADQSQIYNRKFFWRLRGEAMKIVDEKMAVNEKVKTRQETVTLSRGETTLVVVEANPKMFSNHLIVKEDLHDRLYIDRRTEAMMLFMTDGSVVTDREEIKKYLWTYEEFIGEFEKAHPDLEVIAFINNGSLLANEGFVSYSKGKLFHIKGENPFQHPYTSVIVFKDGHVEMGEVRYRQNSSGKICVTYEGRDITDGVVYTTFGQFLLDGKGNVRKDFENIIPQFQDIRHVFQLPRIRVAEIPGMENEIVASNFEIYFGASELVSDKFALAKDAWSRVVKLQKKTKISVWQGHEIKDLEVTLNDDLLRLSLNRDGYQEVRSGEVTERGQYRIDADGVTIFIKHNVYPRTYVGITKTGKIKYIGVRGQQGQLGSTLEESSELMAREGCVQAMIVDHGGSAVIWYKGQYIQSSNLGRMTTTAGLILTQKRSGAKSSYSRKKSGAGIAAGTNHGPEKFPIGQLCHTNVRLILTVLALIVGIPGVLFILFDVLPQLGITMFRDIWHHILSSASMISPAFMVLAGIYRVDRVTEILEIAEQEGMKDGILKEGEKFEVERAEPIGVDLFVMLRAGDNKYFIIEGQAGPNSHDMQFLEEKDFTTRRVFALMINGHDGAYDALIDYIHSYHGGKISLAREALSASDEGRKYGNQLDRYFGKLTGLRKEPFRLSGWTKNALSLLLMIFSLSAMVVQNQTASHHESHSTPTNVSTLYLEYAGRLTREQSISHLNQTERLIRYMIEWQQSISETYREHVGSMRSHNPRMGSLSEFLNQGSLRERRFEEMRRMIDYLYGTREALWRESIMRTQYEILNIALRTQPRSPSITSNTPQSTSLISVISFIIFSISSAYLLNQFRKFATKIVEDIVCGGSAMKEKGRKWRRRVGEWYGRGKEFFGRVWRKIVGKMFADNKALFISDGLTQTRIDLSEPDAPDVNEVEKVLRDGSVEPKPLLKASHGFATVGMMALAGLAVPAMIAAYHVMGPLMLLSFYITKMGAVWLWSTGVIGMLGWIGLLYKADEEYKSTNNPHPEVILKNADSIYACAA